MAQLDVQPDKSGCENQAGPFLSDNPHVLTVLIAHVGKCSFQKGPRDRYEQGWIAVQIINMGSTMKLLLP